MNTSSLNELANSAWAGFGLSNLTCARVDDIFMRMTEMRETLSNEVADPSEIVVPIVGILFSVVFLFAGARVFRVTAALAAGGFAFWAVYSFVRDSGEATIGCDARLIAASIVAVVAALSAGCVYKAGLFFVGAAAAAGVVHMIFSSFPTLHDVEGVPTMGGRSALYYGLIILGAACGGLVLRWHSTLVLEAVTACLGGATLAYSLYAITSIAGAGVDGWVFMLTGIGASLLGAVSQRHLRLNGCGKKVEERDRRRSGRRRDDDSPDRRRRRRRREYEIDLDP